MQRAANEYCILQPTVPFTVNSCSHYSAALLLYCHTQYCILQQTVPLTVSTCSHYSAALLLYCHTQYPARHISIYLNINLSPAAERYSIVHNFRYITSGHYIVIRFTQHVPCLFDANRKAEAFNDRSGSCSSYSILTCCDALVSSFSSALMARSNAHSPFSVGLR